MQWLTVHSVGFGECLVLGGKKQEILMVDCGSMNRRLASGQVFSEYAQQLTESYCAASERSFLLSHFHKDHFCGLPHLLREDPQFFDRIYLPCCPTDWRGNPTLIELSIFIEAFVTGVGSETVRMHAASLRFFSELTRLAGTECIFVLEAGDVLVFDREDYRVLWPPKENYPFAPALQALLERANFLLSRCYDPYATAFLELKDAVCRQYQSCMEAFACQTEADAAQRVQAVEALELLLEELNAMLPRLHTLFVAGKIRELLCDRKTVMQLSAAVNGTSFVLDSPTVLLTGDATPETMSHLKPQLSSYYPIVKAPHHGTAPYWWEGFLDMEIDHLLISNDRAITGGKIAMPYSALDAMHHCTGHHCCFAETYHRCCNEDRRCSHQKQRKTVPACRKNRCGIYLEHDWQEYPCDCRAAGEGIEE